MGLLGRNEWILLFKVIGTSVLKEFGIKKKIQIKNCLWQLPPFLSLMLTIVCDTKIHFTLNFLFDLPILHVTICIIQVFIFECLVSLKYETFLNLLRKYKKRGGGYLNDQ